MKPKVKFDPSSYFKNVKNLSNGNRLEQYLDGAIDHYIMNRQYQSAFNNEKFAFSQNNRFSNILPQQSP